MKEFRKIVLFLLSIVALFLVFVIATFLCVVGRGKPECDTSYNSILQIKYDNLMTTNEKKIVLVGGSSLAFGLNEEKLEEKTGYKVVNLGLHAGMGTLFEAELSKQNINKGDIVLLAYEYEWYKEDAFNTVGIDLIMDAIGSKLSMYKAVPLKQWKQVFRYLMTYAKKKSNYTVMQGVYSRDSFDINGRMILNRPDYVIGDYEAQIDLYGEVLGDKITISRSAKDYLTDYKKYIESKGAEVYFVAPPLLDEAFRGEVSNLDRMVIEEENTIGIRYISDPKQYLFPRKYIFDAIYHCTNEGREYRTDLLIDDICSKVLVE